MLLDRTGLCAARRLGDLRAARDARGCGRRHRGRHRGGAAGERLLRPLRVLARSIEEIASARTACTSFAREAPGEVAPLLYGLHLTHTRLRRTLRQLEWDRAEVATLLEHMTDSVLVLDEHERVVLHNPAAVRMLRFRSIRSHADRRHPRRRSRRAGARSA